MCEFQKTNIIQTDVHPLLLYIHARTITTATSVSSHMLSMLFMRDFIPSRSSSHSRSIDMYMHMLSCCCCCDVSDEKPLVACYVRNDESLHPLGEYHLLRQGVGAQEHDDADHGRHKRVPPRSQVAEIVKRSVDQAKVSGKRSKGTFFKMEYRRKDESDVHRAAIPQAHVSPKMHNGCAQEQRRDRNHLRPP